ncbi:LexA family transcriptional regulator [Orbus wheelerorum]|uniref:LexA family protein n=1 Tax=Orbus wheelerorum TaxID=3074111 RepID=UPI00370D632C
MATLANRIRARREALGLTQDDVAQKVGMTQQSYQAIEAGQTKKPRFLYEISQALQCDMAWLLSGKEEVNIAPVNLKNIHKVPIISYVQAGLWTESCNMEDSTGYEYLLTDLDISANTFALKIKGQSMEPEFVDGDMIVVDPTIKPLPGEFVVAVNGEEEATFKKYRELGYDEHERMQFELVPLNSDYPKMSSLTQQIRIVGTMVEHRTYRRKR